MSESVIITLRDVSTLGLQEKQQGAVIDRQRAQALLTILPNGSPYGVIGWHLDSQFTQTQEPQSKNLIEKKVSDAFCTFNLCKINENFLTVRCTIMISLLQKCLFKLSCLPIDVEIWY